jgi:aromatic-L-amino-acid/L-tryptophan decarboxylase
VDDLDAYNDRLARACQRDGRVYIAPAELDGSTCLRACIVNYRTADDDVHAILDVLADVGARLRA